MPFTSSGDVEIYYERRGAGPPLLLINGFGPPCEWIEEFYLPHFVSHFDCAWFDLRGVGRSTRPAEASDYALPFQAEDAAAVLETLGWDTAHIWGASFGAAVSLELASAYPGLARSVAICSADSGVPDIFQKPYADIFEARRAYFRGLGQQANDPEKATQAMLEAYFPAAQRDTDPRVEPLRQSLIRMLTERPLKSLTWPFDEIARMDITATDLPDTAAPSGAGGTGAVWSRLDAITAPVLLMQGYSDRLVHRDAAYYLADRLPQIELRVIKPAAHSFALSDEQLQGMAQWILHREVEAKL